MHSWNNKLKSLKNSINGLIHKNRTIGFKENSATTASFFAEHLPSNESGLLALGIF